LGLLKEREGIRMIRITKAQVARLNFYLLEDDEERK